MKQILRFFAFVLFTLTFITALCAVMVCMSIISINMLRWFGLATSFAARISALLLMAVAIIVAGLYIGRKFDAVRICVINYINEK